MCRISKNIITSLFLLFFISLTLPTIAYGATSPSLGSSNTYGIVSSTYTNSLNAGLETRIVGDVCYTTEPDTAPISISGATVVPCAPARGTDQSSALTDLNGQACTSLGANVVLSGTYTPGCYSSSGTMDITLGTTVTLSGTGTYIFRSGGAFTSGANSVVTLAGGASACDVFWTPGGAMTLGANSGTSATPTFVGNILRDASSAFNVTLGKFVNLTGRVLAFGRTVTTDSNTITVPTCAAPQLTVTKVVVNDNGGTKVVSNFPIFIDGDSVTSGVANTTTAGLHTVSETSDPGYTSIISGDCATNGTITLATGDVKTCTITNNDNAAHLIVIKNVVNDNGGSSLPSDFSTTISGVTTATPTAPGVASPGVDNTLTSVGAYSVDEGAHVGYDRTLSSGCVGTIALGETKTCTITNTFIPLPVAANNGAGVGGVWALLPLINITKIPSPLALASGPGPVTYRYAVTNIGPVAMTGVWVKDDKCDDVDFINGDDDSNSRLDINETWRYSCTKIISETETNIATTHGQAGGWDTYDTANATVVVGLPLVPPLIHLVKVPSVFVLPSTGGEVTYMYTVTNPGTAALSNVIITDNKCTGLPGRVVGHPGDLNKNDLLESNEKWSFTCQTYLTQTTTNIGTAEGHANGLTAIDSAPATVVVVSPNLPETGFPPNEKNSLGKIATLSEIVLLVLVLLFFGNLCSQKSY